MSLNCYILWKRNDLFMACKAVRWTYGYHPVYDQGVTDKGSLCVTKRNKDIDVSVTAPANWGSTSTINIRYFTMKLQRKEGAVWKTVGERPGYITPESPGHRTFTNVGQPGSKMRINVRYTFKDGRLDTTHYYEFTR